MIGGRDCVSVCDLCLFIYLLSENYVLSKKSKKKEEADLCFFFFFFIYFKDGSDWAMDLD